MSSFSLLGPGRPGRPRGFAYVWTLMLVAFMGVAAVVASDLYATSVRRDKERELIFIGHEFRTAIGRYYNSRAGGQAVYPLTLDELLKDPRFPSPRRHLRRLYVDPVTGKAQWGLLRIQGRIVGVHSLSERQPIKQDNFEEIDANLRLKPSYAQWNFVYPFDLFVPPQDGTPGKPVNPMMPLLPR